MTNTAQHSQHYKIILTMTTTIITIIIMRYYHHDDDIIINEVTNDNYYNIYTGHRQLKSHFSTVTS